MANKIIRTLNSILFFLFIPALLIGQSKNDKTLVGKVGDQKITYAELKQNFSSGNTEEISYENLEDFLPTYLDYKAKLLLAKDEGYFRDSALVEEHLSYVKQAAYAFWIENEIKPSAFEEFKSRAALELKPYHILISVPENAPEQQINDAIDKLNQARKEIENGVPLEEVNEKYSSKRSGQSMGGDVPWISAGRTVKGFEEVIYDLEVGEVSDPFRTQFGYHIVLLQDKRERTPARLTKHIFVRGAQDSASFDKIQEAYNQLEEGKAWNEVLRKYTEDSGSINNQGSIGWVSYHSNFATDFVNAIRKIDPSIEYSEPVKTDYGYHIFKIDSIQTYETEEAHLAALMEQMKDTYYFEENNEFAIDYLKDKFNAKEHIDTIAEYEKWITINDSLLISELPAPSSLTQQKVYEFNGKDYLVRDYHNYLKKNYKTTLAKNYQNNWLDQFTDDIVDANIIALTIEHNPEFEQQSENYLNGLVVYNINNDKIWSAATVDTSRLRTMYENNVADYEYPERPFYYLLTARHDSTLNKAITLIKDGVSPDSLRKHITRIGISSDSTTYFTDEPFDRLHDLKANSFSDKFDYNNTRAVFWVEDWLPARTMTFDEAFNRILSVYQPQREQEWLDKLRDKYNVEAKYNNLRKAFQKDK